MTNHFFIYVTTEIVIYSLYHNLTKIVEMCNKDIAFYDISELAMRLLPQNVNNKEYMYGYNVLLELTNKN